MIDFETLQTWMTYLLPGVAETLKATAVAGIIFPILGIFICYMRLSGKKFLRFFATVYIEFLRGTPLIGQLFVAYYVFPFFGISLSAPLVGASVLGLNASAYAAEAFRAGIESIPHEQWEAGRILNLSTLFIFFRIILPQSMSVILPVMGNELITLMRATAALSLLGVGELLFRARDLSSVSYQPFPIMTIVLLLYFAMSYPASELIRFIERKLNYASTS
jgi:His/Glu/Gln/Arg/opine family amino acid ABC transporter permease subunit